MHRSAAVTSDSRWQPGHGLLVCDHADVTVLLSLQRSRYHLLDNIAGRIWRQACAGATLTEIAAGLAKDFNVPVSQAMDDVAEIVSGLSSNGLVQPLGRGPRTKDPARFFAVASSWPASQARSTCARTRVLPSVIACIGRLLAVRLAVAVLGVPWLLSQLYRVEQPENPSPGNRTWLRGVARQVTLASTVVPFRAECLEQSLCLLWIGRNAGISTQLRLGVRPFPFLAHAWIDYKDISVNDPEEFVMTFYRFRPIAEMVC